MEDDSSRGSRKMTTKIAVLLLGCLKLAVGPGVLTVFDFYKVDVTLPTPASSEPDEYELSEEHFRCKANHYQLGCFEGVWS